MTCQNCGASVPLVVYKRTSGYCTKCELMTIPEVLARLRISRATYYRLARAGKLRLRHPSGKRRILVLRSDVDTLLTN